MDDIQVKDLNSYCISLNNMIEKLESKLNSKVEELTKDIKEIKEYVFILAERLKKVDQSVQILLARPNEPLNVYDNEDLISAIEDCFVNVFESEDEYNPINRIQDKLNALVAYMNDDKTRKKEVVLAEKTLDKFEDYMKNVDKVNAMINEFKGCISLARAALEERKEIEKQKKNEKKPLKNKGIL
jgi:methyl-accepting chemotaxis protein